MPIQLDKILADIAEEKALHPNFPEAKKEDIDDAWSRVGKSNKLSVHEARSIFKVLQKKYEQEKSKPKSSWKLFNIMEEIHMKVEVKPIKAVDENDLPLEEEEEFEMLEVQEEDENAAGLAPPASNSTCSSSDSGSPAKSMAGSPEKEEHKPLVKSITPAGGAKQHPVASKKEGTVSPTEEKKVLNSLASATARSASSSHTAQTPASAFTALRQKGIIMKKTLPTGPANSGAGAKSSSGVYGVAQVKSSPGRSGGNMLEVGKTIQLPESLKRKLSEDQPSSAQTKKVHVGQAAPPAAAASNAQHTATKMVSQPSRQSTATPPIKQEPREHQQQQQQHQQQQETQISQSTASAGSGINVITIPAARTDVVNGLSRTVNGFSPRIEDIDFRNDIIFEAGAENVNGTGVTQSSKVSAVASTTEIVNLGNFDNTLPPTFFKNLCNSSRHEALGLYVANVMNRLRPSSASKLELGILRAIIDVQSSDLDDAN